MNALSRSKISNLKVVDIGGDVIQVLEITWPEPGRYTVYVCSSKRPWIFKRAYGYDTNAPSDLLKREVLESLSLYSS